jgi:DHA1 family multidrug resistance protein-like MFS transporter
MNWKIFTTLFLAIFAAMLGQGIVVPLLPVYAHDLGATGFSIGILFGAFSLSRTVFLPYFGSVSDRAGRKPFLTAGLLAYFLASIAYMFSRDVVSLITVRLFQGIAAAMVMPVAQAYVGEITPKGREGFTMGLLNVSVYAGLSAGPVLGGTAKDMLGIKASFLSMGVLCAAALILCMVLLPPRRKEALLSRDRPREPVMMLLRNSRLLGMFLFRFATTMCVGAFWSFMPLIADTGHHLSGAETGVLIMLSVLISAVLAVPVGYLSDRFSKRLLAVLGGMLSVASMLLFAFSSQPWGLYGSGILLGISGGLSVPPIMAMAVSAGRAGKRMGSVISLVTMGHSLGMMTGPILSGILFDMLGVRTAFLAVSACMAVMTLIFLLLTAGNPPMEKSSGKSRTAAHHS